MDDLVLMQIRKAAADASLVGILHPAFPSPPVFTSQSLHSAEVNEAKSVRNAQKVPI